MAFALRLRREPELRASVETWLAWQRRRRARLGAAKARAAARSLITPDDLKRKGHALATTRRYDVKDLSLAQEGVRRIEWADRQMPVLAAIRERFEREQPLAGHRDRGVPPRHHRDREPGAHPEGGRRRRRAVRVQPALHPGRRRCRARRRVRHLGLRDQGRGQRHLLPAHRGGRRPQAAHHDGRRRRRDRRPAHARGASSSATSSPAPRRRRPASSGCKALERDGALGFPVIAVNDADTKHMFDNRYGTGQWTIDGIIRATNMLLAGKHFRGRRLRLVRPGVAMRAKGHGRARDRDRGRPAEGAGGGDGRVPGDADGPARPRSATSSAPPPATSRSSARAHRGDEGRRDRRQHAVTSTWRSTSRRCARSPPRRARRAQFVEEFRWRRPAGLPARRRAADQPRRGRRSSRRWSWTCPSPTRRSSAEYAVEHAASWSGRCTACPRRSTRDRAAQARDDGRRDRHS